MNPLEPPNHFAKSILGGKPLKGLWFNRTEEFAARNRGEDFGRLKYAEEEELVLSQLPCWADLTPEQYRERIAELVEEIELDARADREARGIEPMGAEAILRQDPHDRPNQTKKSPAPAYHAASKAARERFWEAYSAFVAAFREAAEKLKTGDRTAKVPAGLVPARSAVRELLPEPASVGGAAATILTLSLPPTGLLELAMRKEGERTGLLSAIEASGTLRESPRARSTGRRQPISWENYPQRRSPARLSPLPETAAQVTPSPSGNVWHFVRERCGSPREHVQQAVGSRFPGKTAPNDDHLLA